MAARTLTYTANMSVPARSNHVGVQALTFAFNSGANLFGTVSDVALLGKIPNGATILGGHIHGKTAAATSTIFILSTVNSLDFTKSAQVIGTFTASATGATLVNLSENQLLPLRVSLSADATTTEAVLYCNCTAGPSETASVSINGVIYYVADGRDTSL